VVFRVLFPDRAVHIRLAFGQCSDEETRADYLLSTASNDCLFGHYARDRKLGKCVERGYLI
jgi:hypothetical protein